MKKVEKNMKKVEKSCSDDQVGNGSNHSTKKNDKANGLNDHKSKDEPLVSNTEEEVIAGGKKKKRSLPDNSEQPPSTRKMPKRSASAASKNLKENSFSISDKSCLIETKKDQIVEEEFLAVRMTAGHDDGHPNRRLTDFILHDETGAAQPLEMLEINDIFITGLILPLEANKDKKKEEGVRCEGFGRIEAWNISGYEDGSPVIWISTDIADYDCQKPAASYKKYYDHFFEKSRACIEVYKKLAKSSGGDPDISLDELLAGLARSMSGSKNFSGTASLKEFVISQGEFIYKQLIGLDMMSKSNDKGFTDIPALAALRDESKKQATFEHRQVMPSNVSLRIGSGIGDEEKKNQMDSVDEEDEDAKLARLLQEEEDWNSRKQKKNPRSSSSSNKFYIKINEDEIANDYPLPAYYKTSLQETDEFIVFDNDYDVYDIEDRPRSMLHNWALYNSDSRLISLELLPMKPCSDIDVTIFGSGTMTTDDGSGFQLDIEDGQSSCASGAQVTDGIPIYLSAIKEWMIEFGSSMVFISIRTDMAWYRLGKPSKQYTPWYDTVLKTARLGISTITLLKEQSRVSRLSFTDVIKKLSEFSKDHKSYISSDPKAVERYVVVHGQIILQLFEEYPDDKIRKSAFVTGLRNKMEERHHTKWLVKKKKVLLRNEPNLNPRAGMAPVVSKRKAMQATTTKLINRIWGEYYSNHLPEDSKEGTASELKDDDEAEEQEQEPEENEDEDAEEETVLLEGTQKPRSVSKQSKAFSDDGEIRWEGASEGKTSSGCLIYKQAIIHGEVVSVGAFVSVEVDEPDEFPDIYYIEYMFESKNGRKMFHGRMMQHGCQTVLGNAANEREVFLTNECRDFGLQDVKQTNVASIRKTPWGHQHRKDNIVADKLDRERAEERKKKGLPIEYYCKSLYWPERGAFFSLPFDTLGLGSGVCHSCKLEEAEKEKDIFKVNSSKSSFVLEGTEYFLNDYVYVSPFEFEERIEQGTHKSGRNVGLKAYVVCQVLEIFAKKETKQAEIKSTEVKVRRFFRPEDVSNEKAYCSDVQEVYYSEEICTVSVQSVEGKCEIRKKNDILEGSVPGSFQNVFFCEHLYDPGTGSLKKLPATIKVKYSTGHTADALARKKKGKCIEGDSISEPGQDRKTSTEKRLATLDIFAGCGGLSEGLHQSGVSSTKWAIEYDEPAGNAFKANHPEALVFINNCNVILRAIMDKCGDIDDCISTTEAAELTSSLDEKELNSLPLPGQVDFINGGPPCQGFSGMNRFNTSTWSKVQCEMILAFLSFADYFRPRYFLLENVRNFVSFNKGQTFRLTLASLLEMGYQVRFGILEAGAFGVSQSRKRAFIWAASPQDVLPEWPEPMHVFSAPQLRITLSEKVQYAAVRSTANGAPLRAITVRDTIGDLPAVSNGASRTTMEYKSDPVSWFQKKIRGNMAVLTDHISKEMNELNLIRCQKIPKRPGCDWRDLPDEKIKLSTGTLVDLIPWCLPNTAMRHNQWKGLFGRLDWQGNFPTSITDPQPMGKVGMCFHPDQDRILTVRECARSQGFPDCYQFSGNIIQKHRQIGNAVPPPLAFALGRKLKEAVDSKSSK